MVDVEENRQNFAPTEVLRVIASHGQDPNHGMSRRGREPWRYRWQLTGRDRVEVGKALQKTLRDLGYEADAIFWP